MVTGGPGVYRGPMLHVESRDGGRIVLATIDRQQRRNAVDHDTLVAIARALEDASLRLARVFVLTGAGGHFSAGADLSGVEGEEFQAALRRVLTDLSRVPMVTIAAIDGTCLGAGMQLAGFSDLRVATHTARFGIPAARLGVAIDQATAGKMVELCGGGPARAMLLAARTYDGIEAERLGLVDRSGDLSVALAWAAEIARLAPLTIAAHKEALAALFDNGRGQISDGVRSAFDRAWASSDLQEGRRAFAEKRPPDFTGR